MARLDATEEADVSNVDAVQHGSVVRRLPQSLIDSGAASEHDRTRADVRPAASVPPPPSSERVLDQLYEIRNILLDVKDEHGSLDGENLARFADVEREIERVHRAEATRSRASDPVWARLDELAAQLLADIDPPGGRS